MTRLTDTCEKEVRELIASLNGLPGFQHEKELMGEVDYLRDSFLDMGFVKKHLEKEIDSLNQRIFKLRCALKRISSPDYAGMDGMIIADMGLKHFTEHFSKSCLAEDDREENEKHVNAKRKK